MAEASKGGCVLSADSGAASTRPAASASGTRSGERALTPSRTRSRASWTGSSAISVGNPIVAGLAAGLLDEPDSGNHHSPVDGFCHVVDGEAGDGGRRQRLHLDAGLAGDTGERGDPQARQ